MQSHRGFSACTVRQANGVSVPHWPTATTRRSPAAARAGRVDEINGAPTTAPVATPARFKNARRLRDRAMARRPPASECGRMVTSAPRACQRRQPTRRPTILLAAHGQPEADLAPVAEAGATRGARRGGGAPALAPEPERLRE